MTTQQTIDANLVHFCFCMILRTEITLASFSFSLLWCDTRCLRMPALRSASSQAGPMRKCIVARHHQANLMCVVCSCCVTSPYREVCRAKGVIGSGETLCHDIYPAWPITTVSLATNTYCMIDGHSSCAPRSVGHRVHFSGACEQSHWWPATTYSRKLTVISGSSSD